MEYDEDGRPIFGPVVDFTAEDVRLGVEAARRDDPRTFMWRDIELPYFSDGYEPEIPHNYVTGVGDCFDWLDRETRLLVRAAIELADDYKVV